MMIINTDCKYYLGNKPCKFHKIDKRECEECSDYHKIEKYILIIKLDALGDVLRTTSILPSLHSKYPGASITWVTRKNAISILENNPFIHHTLAVEDNYLPFILNEQFDIAISLDADSESSTILALSNSKSKLGFTCNNSGNIVPANPEAEQWYLMGLNDNLKVRNRLTYQEIIYSICNLEGKIFRPQIFFDEKTKHFSQSFKIKYDLLKFNKIVGINTGGGTRWECKKWMLPYYIELIDMLIKNYPETGIILFGGPEENDFNKEIIDQKRDCLIDAGCNNSIMEFAGLIDLVDIFVTPDSLGMHIGVALSKNTIVLVGPTSPWELNVFGKGEILYNSELECIACYDSVCRYNKECMMTITPSRVFNTINTYLWKKSQF